MLVLCGQLALGTAFGPSELSASFSSACFGFAQQVFVLAFEAASKTSFSYQAVAPVSAAADWRAWNIGLLFLGFIC